MNRKRKRSIISGVITVLAVSAIVLVNVISGVLVSKYPAFTADITSMQAFGLTEQSRDIAENLKKKVKITFLSEKREYENRDPYCKQTSVTANEMAKLSDGMISVEYIDIVKEPTLARKYNDESLTANDIAVTCGDKTRILKVTELFTFEAYSSEYQYISSSQSESMIDNAIVTVTSDVITKVALISDNSSKGYEYFAKTLEENNYEVTEISLENDEIEKDTDMIIIYEPEKDFTENALLKLENFLVNDENYGKNLVYVPDIEGAEHTRLDSFVGMFGMSVTDGVAFEYDESRRYYSSNYYEYLICDFASNLYRENFSDERYTPVMTGLSRPIYIKSKDVEPLLVLSEKSGTVPYTADDDWSMEDSITGNICVMAQVEIGSEEKSSAFVAIGSGTMLSETYFVNSLGNRNYIMTMLATLNGRESEIISVSDKVITNFDIDADAHTRFWIGFVIYAVIPLMILGCGLTVYLVRRGK